MVNEKYNQFSITKRLIQTKLDGFTVTEKAILISLVSYMKKDNNSKLSCYVGQKTIADQMGTTTKKVISALKKFEDKGFISSIKRFDNSKIYTWLGIDEKERSFNITKVKRTQQEWEAYFKNKPNIERLERELKQAKESVFKNKEESLTDEHN